jgi:hypothetical protein
MVRIAPLVDIVILKIFLNERIKGKACFDPPFRPKGTGGLAKKGTESILPGFLRWHSARAMS